MAELEREMSIGATYYFRAKPHVFKPEIIKKIEGLGHEIGYHYECLSDANGDMVLALKDFEHNLKRLREIVPIRTISMHGRPLGSLDNRDIWRNPQNHVLLDKHGILGEVYLDIDYTDIAYINDTGRNWTSAGSNRRDQVASYVEAAFGSGDHLMNCLSSSPHPKMIFQIHPERWTDHPLPWLAQWMVDSGTNAVKGLIGGGR